MKLTESRLRKIIKEEIQKLNLVEKLDMSGISLDPTFLYKLLSRLQQDCEYYLGFGGRSIRNLWGGKDHIKYMYAIHDKLKKKPEWLSLNDIKKYEKDMKL
jgi:hypothetical protein